MKKKELKSDLFFSLKFTIKTDKTKARFLLKWRKTNKVNKTIFLKYGTDKNC